ncbi:hypothetical protein, partial [Streptomyces sp. NPDC059742]|uniref:hypothetical protein n=1 Tax=Streptomyces sp. NPDC059742 TaxID=3346927 RepID=UPI0036689BC1
MARWLATARPQHPVLAWQESTHSDALDTFEELLGGLDAHDAQRWKAKRADFAARTTLGSLLNDRAEYVVGRALDAYQLGNTKVRNPDFVLPPTGGGGGVWGWAPVWGFRGGGGGDIAGVRPGRPPGR